MSARVQMSVTRVHRTSGHDLTTERPRPTTQVIRGVVTTPLGLVAVFSFRGPATGHSRFEFVAKGRVYRRTEEQAHSARGLAILAGRFARDVIAVKVRS